jgi:two-component system cell cycle sensor histidine kinase/response regulator CckA
VDVRLLAHPSWWNVRRTLFVAGGLGALALLVLSWGITLRRRVRAQTEQIRLQLEKEKRMQTEIERSTRLESLGVLAGGIAHDFNNLLTAILGNLGLAALDKRVMDAAGDCIVEAERGARRARDITQQLLTFAKGGDPVRMAVPLAEIVTEAATFARHGTNVRFDFDFPSNLPPGNVDAGQISRVVHNLVINAVQAMPEGGVVSIALAAVDVRVGEVATLAPGSYLLLTVADTGRGISAENLARIFDPYFSTQSGTGNSGLGLATVRSIVRKHHGHVEVDSKVGEGTTFRIWLPAAPHEMLPERPAPPGSNGHPSARILVMDDEDVIRRVAGRMLALAGHETSFASDGAEAVRIYTEARQAGRPFDLVIFDLTVPGGMGGKEAVQELLKIDPEIRAIASSGYSSDAVMANPRAYGFRASLAKPYDIPGLMRVVGEVRHN